MSSSILIFYFIQNVFATKYFARKKCTIKETIEL